MCSTGAALKLLLAFLEPCAERAEGLVAHPPTELRFSEEAVVWSWRLAILGHTVQDPKDIQRSIVLREHKIEDTRVFRSAGIIALVP